MKHIIPFLIVVLSCGHLAWGQPVRYSSDSKTDLQSVVDQLDDGGALIVEAGTYQLEKPIEIRKNVTIVGSPDADTIIQGRNGCFVVNAPKQDDKQVTLAHLTLAVNSGNTRELKNDDEATKHAVLVTSGNAKLIQCHLASDSGCGLQVEGANTRTEIVRSKVSKCAWNGILYRKKASGLIEECEIYEITQPCVAIANGANVSIRNSKIHSSPGNGILYTNKGTSGLIEGGEIYETASPCVAIADGANVSIRNSEIYRAQGTAAGIYCKGQDTQVTIKGCKIEDNGGNGIDIVSSNVTIEDCLLAGNGDSQLEFSKGAKLTVRKSSFSKGKKFGVATGAQAGEATFVDCHFGENDESGLALTGCGVTTPKFTFEKCTIYGNKRNQVIIAGGVDVTMRDSSILNGGRHPTDETYHPHGVVMVGATTKALFEKCVFNSHNKADIYLHGEADPVFRNCKIYRGLGKESGILIVDNAKGLFENCELYDYDFPAVEIRDGGNPTFRNCKIRRGSGTSNGVQITDNGKGLFDNCELYGFGDDWCAIAIQNGGNPTFKNCTIRNNNVGVYVLDQGRGTFEGNRLSGNSRNWVIERTAGQVTRRNNSPNR